MSIRVFAFMLAGLAGPGSIALADPVSPALGKPQSSTQSIPAKLMQGPSRQLWGKGQLLPAEYRGTPFENWHRHGLAAAPPGYLWVRVGRDAYLVERESGTIAQALIGVLVD